MSNSCSTRPLKELSSNHSNRRLSQRDALVHVCDHTHTPKPWAFQSEVNTHTYHPPHMHTQPHNTVCVRERARESDSKGHFTNAACQGGGEQHSNSSITTIKHTSNQERESERCHRSREGRGEVERKERRPTKKEKNTDREEEKKLYMLERDNYQTCLFFTHQLIHWKNKIEKNVWFFIY